MPTPLTPEVAIETVDEWLQQPPSLTIVPSHQHWSIYKELLMPLGTAAVFAFRCSFLDCNNRFLLTSELFHFIDRLIIPIPVSIFRFLNSLLLMQIVFRCSDPGSGRILQHIISLLSSLYLASYERFTTWILYENNWEVEIIFGDRRLSKSD